MFRRAGPARILSALGRRNYGIYVAGNAVSLTGMWMQRIAIGWLAWTLTGSGGWLGAIAFADLFPTVVFGPLAGVVTDRLGPFRIIRAAQTIAMLLAFALFGLTAAGLMTAPLLLAFAAANGAVLGFNQPARLSVVQALVPRSDLPTAVALNSVVFNLARFLGPAAAGVTILHLGVAAAFLANALSYLAFLYALSRMDLPAPPPGRRGAGPGLFAEAAEGVRYVARHPGIGPLLLLLTVLSVGCRPFIELLPGFADAVFGRGVDGLAILSSSVGIGAVIGGLWLAMRDGEAGLARLALSASLAVPVAVLLFCAGDRLWPAAAAAAVAGGATVIGGAGAQTLLQLSVEDAIRARVLSLYGLIFRAGPAVGSLAMGLAAEVAGLRAPLVAGGVVGLAAGLWTWRRRRAIIGALEKQAGGQT